MNVTSDLNLIPTSYNKTRVIPRREDAEGSREWCVWSQEVFMFTYLSMRDPSLALGMTEDGRPQFTIP
jgi:hypothetical protein